MLSAGDHIDEVTAETPVIAVVMPNEATVKERAWTAYITSVDDVEQRNGYDFLARLPDDVEDELEARVAVPPP